jgi:hypothetical protein
MYPAAALVARIPSRPFASSTKESKIIYLLAVAPEATEHMQLETERLILRSFREEDVDAMARLFANPDFMRFSLGVFTEHKQTVAFIEKVTGWDRADIPSQFAVVLDGERRSSATAVFFITLKCRVRSRSGTDWIPITGTVASSAKPRALCAITALRI